MDERRSIEAAGKPELPWLIDLTALVAVREVEGPTGGTRQLHLRGSGIHEPRGGRQVPVGAERGFQRGNEQHLVTGTIVEIAGTFGVNTVGSVGLHAVVIVFPDLPEHGGSLGRGLVRDREGTQTKTAEADLVPVHRLDLPTAAFQPDARLEPFFKDRLPHLVAGGGGQVGKQPVVAQRQRCGHLRGVEEVRWIPIGERRDGKHFLFRTVEKPFVARDPVGEAPQPDPLQRLARNRQQALAFLVIDDRWLSQRRDRILHGYCQNLCNTAFAAVFGTDVLPVVRGEDKTRMFRAQPGQDVGRFRRTEKTVKQKGD
jgi:hypothetical protein